MKMRRHVALLHTAPANIETFDRLLKSADATIEIEHILDERLLEDAQVVGAQDAELIGRIHDAMTAAAANGATLVVCTCSTIGGAAERTSTEGFVAGRIDRAMADRAVSLGKTILLVGALEGTMQPSTQLIQESAEAAGATVVVRRLLVEAAWPHFLKGDREEYVRLVCEAVRSSVAADQTIEVVVLAQASMAQATETLTELRVPVLASPALGVEKIVAFFEAAP